MWAARRHPPLALTIAGYVLRRRRSWYRDADDNGTPYGSLAPAPVRRSARCSRRAMRVRGTRRRPTRGRRCSRERGNRRRRVLRRRRRPRRAPRAPQPHVVPVPSVARAGAATRRHVCTAHPWPAGAIDPPAAEMASAGNEQRADERCRARSAAAVAGGRRSRRRRSRTKTAPLLAAAGGRSLPTSCAPACALDAVVVPNVLRPRRRVRRRRRRQLGAGAREAQKHVPTQSRPLSVTATEV